MVNNDAAPEDWQARIDAIRWYHEFDFPNGLKARSPVAETEGHKQIWAFIRRSLDQIDFRGKSVLDIGCWDGYWSFYAERRGAARVLATDDQSQNWSTSTGILLAKELLDSKIEVKLDVSVYELERLHQKFDVILCMGVYYHLIDPFHAFAQIRHCCHRDTVVIVEGDVTTGLRPDTAYFDFSDASLPVFVPTPVSLKTLLKAAYLEPLSQNFLDPITPFRTAIPKKVWLGLRDRIRGSVWTSVPMIEHQGRLPDRINRAVTICRPFEGVNEMHQYKPPFGLTAFDERFRGQHS